MQIGETDNGNTEQAGTNGPMRHVLYLSKHMPQRILAPAAGFSDGMKRLAPARTW